MTPIHLVGSAMAITTVLLAAATSAPTHTMRSSSELHRCGEEASPCVGCWIQVYGQLRSAPAGETRGPTEQAASGTDREMKLARRTAVLLRFLVCMVRELARELIDDTFSFETRS